MWRSRDSASYGQSWFITSHGLWPTRTRFGAVRWGPWCLPLHAESGEPPTESRSRMTNLLPAWNQQGDELDAGFDEARHHAQAMRLSIHWREPPVSFSPQEVLPSVAVHLMRAAESVRTCKSWHQLQQYCKMRNHFVMEEAPQRFDTRPSEKAPSETHAHTHTLPGRAHQWFRWANNPIPIPRPTHHPSPRHADGAPPDNPISPFV